MKNITGYIKALKYIYINDYNLFLKELNDLLECEFGNIEYTNSNISIYRLTLYDLPKLSLNKWYAGEYWKKRVQIKNIYNWQIHSQIKNTKFNNKNSYYVEYKFFHYKPLDASNTVAMTKIIEDIIFENDNYNIIREISLSSIKEYKKNKERIEIYIYKLKK